MYLTPHRLEIQIDKADKLQRIIWRLYSPYKKHRKLIVKASYICMELVETLEELLRIVKEDFKDELINKKSIPPGYLEKKKENKEGKSE